MRFDVIPDNSTRVYDGPFYGVRLLAASPGAVCLIDNMPLPTAVLPGYQAPRGRPFRQIVLTGPATLALADAEDERMESLTASPFPPAAGVTLVARVTGLSSARVGNKPALVPVTLPPGVVGLLALANLDTYVNNSELYLTIQQMYGASGQKAVATTYEIGVASPTSPPNVAWLGRAVAGPYGVNTTTLANNPGYATPLYYSAPLVVPGPCLLGIDQPSAGNVWSADVLAVVG